MNLTIAILDFGFRFGSEWSMLATDAENTKNRTRSEFYYDGRKFQRLCVNMIDIKLSV